MSKLNVKKAKVLILPAEKYGIIGKNIHRDILFYHPSKIVLDNAINQHLYITSDQEIKKGNYYLFHLNNQICRAETQLEILNNHLKNGDVSKIIATTDSSLNLSKPTGGFIKKYIEKYNKGEVITHVLVEYVCPQCKEWGYTEECRSSCNKRFLELKLSSQNEITIHPVKQSWTREEVENLMMQAWIFGEANKDKHYSVREKWIEVNL